MNEVVLVGRLVLDPQINETKKEIVITLKVNRNIRNEYGEYDSDYIPVKLEGLLSERFTKHCKVGDTIGIKGRVTRLTGQDLEIVANKLTFIPSGKVEE